MGRENGNSITVEGVSVVADAKWKPEQDASRRTLTTVLIFLVFVLAAGALAVALVALHKANDDNSTSLNTEQSTFEVNNFASKHLTSKIAFGSCTTYYLYPQPIWTTGVVPSGPDAWIWLGDMVYFDTSMNYCPREDYEDLPDCMCERTLTKSPPFQCIYGDLALGQEKLRRQLYDNDYMNFLHYMCPDMDSKSFPPDGESCEKPIIGTYDDHDFGLNDGNRRLEYKYEYKNMFLDALGVDEGSPRRNRLGGLQVKYKFNSLRRGRRQIDVFLLDERYERDTLPCGVRREWCEGILAEPEEDSDDYIWCRDFNGTDGQLGSCCEADDVFANGWCKENTKDGEDDDLWDVACNPTSELYGSKQVEIDPDTNKLRERETYDREDLTYLAPFCDVLGIEQRRWFQDELLYKSRAPLKIIGSGSVVFGDPRPQPGYGPCAGDDMDCYKQSQTNLIEILNKVENGCVVILVGDYHVSDIKMVQGGNQTYSDYYPTENLTRPIYQVMSSGLTETTARYGSYDDPCTGWRKDELGLRPFGPCSIVVKPSFGMLEFDWSKRIVHLQLRSKETGEVTTAVDGSRQELTINLDTCERVMET